MIPALRRGRARVSQLRGRFQFIVSDELVNQPPSYVSQRAGLKVGLTAKSSALHMEATKIVGILFETPPAKSLIALPRASQLRSRRRPTSRIPLSWRRICRQGCRSLLRAQLLPLPCQHHCHRWTAYAGVTTGAGKAFLLAELSVDPTKATYATGRAFDGKVFIRHMKSSFECYRGTKGFQFECSILHFCNEYRGNFQRLDYHWSTNECGEIQAIPHSFARLLAPTQGETLERGGSANFMACGA